MKKIPYFSEAQTKKFIEAMEYLEDDFNLEDYLDDDEEEDACGDICEYCDDDCSQCIINILMQI